MTAPSDTEKALLRMVADRADFRGVALTSAIIDKYGDGYIELAPSLIGRGYLVARMERHVLALTSLGKQAIGK